MNKIYYNQADARWASHIYTSSGNKSQTMKSSGCGPTAGAMIISSLKEIVYPNIIADMFVENGYRSANNGTYLKAFEFIAQKYNLTVNLKYKLDDAVECLKHGGMVVACCKAGLFSTGGHIIVLAGMKDDNTIIVYDPYLYANKFKLFNREGKAEVEGNNVYVSYANFKEYANYGNLYCYEPTNVNVEIPKQEQIIEEPKAQIKNTVGQIKTFNKAVVLYSNSNLSGTTYQYKVNTTVEVLENVTANIDKIKVRATGRIAYVDNTNLYKESNANQIQTIKNTVGQIKKFKGNTTLYSNSDLTGTKYQYLPNTTIVILQNINSTIDKVKVRQTGRIAYVNISAYK